MQNKQWMINLCTFPMMIKQTTFFIYKLLVDNLGHYKSGANKSKFKSNQIYWWHG